MTIETQERTAANVVTSENLAEFMSAKLDLAKPVVAAAEAKAAEVTPKVESNIEPPDEVPPQEGDTPEQHAEKVKNSYQKLREQRNAARDEAVALKASNEAAAKELAELRAKVPAPAVEANPKPDPTKFTDQAAFDEAMMDWRVDERLRKRDADAAVQRATQQHETAKKQFQARRDDFLKEVPDYTAKVEKSDVVVHPLIEAAIYESEIGPRMLLHFAEHPAEAASLNALPPAKMMRELGRLETRLEAIKAAPVPKLEIVKDKPKVEPIEPLSGGKVVSDPLGADGEFKGTPAEWRALREAGKIK